MRPRDLVLGERSQTQKGCRLGDLIFIEGQDFNDNLSRHWEQEVGEEGQSAWASRTV